MKIKGVTVTTHYAKSDKKCWGDYYSIDVIVRTTAGQEFGFQYGDHYHDKGYDKAEGVIDAIRTIFGSKVPVVRIDVADIEDYE